MSNDELFQRLRDIFKVEAEEHIKNLSDGMLALEKSNNNSEKEQIIENILRITHSLKGSARSVNMFQVVNICQVLENMFLALKKEQITLSEDIFDLLYQSVDITIALLSGDKTKSVVMSSIIKKLNNYIDNSGLQEDVLNPLFNKTMATTVENIVPDITELKKNDTTKRIVPQIQEIENLDNSLLENSSNNIKKNNELSIDEFSEQGFFNTDIEVIKTVRVDVAKLDSLLLQSEEMLTIKLSSEQHLKCIVELSTLMEEWQEESNKISSEIDPIDDYINPQKNTSEISSYLNTNNSYAKLLKNKVKNLLDFVKQQDDLINTMVNNLLEDTKKTLMMPFSSVLESFPRMVRDIARQQNKKVELTMIGTSIEVDKRLLDEIKDALIHLLRNSLDHGLELPETRLKHGKQAEGNLKISLIQLSNNKIEINISDDGSGIDLVRIKEIAHKSGISTNNLSEKEIIDLIFRSGFSTSKILTDLSGRGLGVSIARDKAEKLGGTISVDSVIGLGTTFKMLLPITLSTLKGLVIMSGGKHFVFPMLNVVRTIRVQSQDIKIFESNETIVFDNEVISIISLADALNLTVSKTTLSKSESEIINKNSYIPVIITTGSNKKIAFYVDKILYEQEIMIKNLGKQLSRVNNISGVTFIGDGKIVPLIDVQQLINSVTDINSVRTRLTEIKKELKDTSPDKRKRSILVAEDSITSRTLLKNILETAGYKVKTTIDGEEAFKVLMQEEFDLVVSDVEMPRMNGFELTTKIRQNKKFGNVPVILVTSLAAREDQERGIEVGANAYIVKSSFDQNNLLNIIPKLI